MSTTSHNEPTVETKTPMPVGLNRLARYGLLAMIVASVVNAVIRVVALAVFDIPTEFLPLRGFTIGSLPLGWGPVVLFSTIGVIGATIVYGVISHRSHRPNRTFTVVAVVVLVLSFGAFLTPLPVLSNAPGSAFATLTVMHVTAATASVAVLTRTTGSEDPRPR